MASCYYEVIWKGQDGVLSIPFDVSGYSEISLTILTLGDVKIVYEQERLTIEDGYITISYDNTDLDVLPDGVIRYIIDYEIGNVDGVLSSNLNAVLKTPEGYSAGTIDELMEEAYESGYTAGAVSAFTEGYNSGYTDGYGSGYTSGRTDGYDEGYTDGDQAGYNEGYDNGVQDGKRSGYTEGVGYQKSLLSAITITTNGDYTRENGYSAVTVSVPQTGATPEQVQEAYNSGYTNGENDGFDNGHTSGYTDGVSYQRSLLSSISITGNGQYVRENGYSAITVDVPQTGATPQQVQQAYDSGYTNGHTSGYTDGTEHQKSLLVSTAITVNGTYSRENGYSTISVNVPQTGATPQQVQAAYNSGLTGGYSSGITYQKSLLTDITITGNGEYTRTDGYNSVTVSVPQTGATPEQMQIIYESGITEGTKQQRALLSATTLQANGTYTSYNGWSAVTVQVETTGYTEEDLKAAYQSGLTDGMIIGGGECGDYDNDYFTFKCISGNGIHVSQSFVGEIEYMRTGQDAEGYNEWHTISGKGDPRYTAVIPLYPNDEIHFRANLQTLSGLFGIYDYNSQISWARCNVYGNIMSLVNSRHFSSATTIPSIGCFESLFGYCSGIEDASNLIMPATTLKKNCYKRMFSGCTNMHTAPVLPATVLVDSCYKEMFGNCPSLNRVECYATDISATDCTSGWLSNVSSTGTFVKNPNMSNWTTGNDGIPSNWTVVDAS